ncbi:MAG: 2TM domain-containing protein [Candidatus Bipolaricaulota bacterium]|nr:2TM domain-containing protein [Candidatus Bipolaricaulota bacterium]MCS7274237.1 2TM domain-containing protein [Candidatus Bipolaricaulota bacterium]MDW8110513.1 2TM domain-containing protein [Candidatus Bipolaricaulota bacterium]
MTPDLFEQGLRGELRERVLRSHPSFAKLLSYAQDDLEAPERRRVSAHLVGCRRCQEELVAIRSELVVLERALPKLRPVSAPSMGVSERLRALGNSLSERLWGRPAVYAHVAVYATAAVVLVLLNLSQLAVPSEPGVQGGGGVWWVQWPLLGWGALVLWHSYRVWRRR